MWCSLRTRSIGMAVITTPPATQNSTCTPTTSAIHLWTCSETPSSFMRPHPADAGRLSEGERLA
jgi:hypothetical protein